ncbi:hypothetical protein [Nocardiopsis lambiniae]|uniref:PPM-type phosphatase domain-containing protein n=1 Tax=Nocardiopsis lambiniae TaxID=3075539 RepID=A0ABU2M2K2_9ACTN|nr:hypothetical protein [Nocardiopsis sp. DSM 44743]MDT0326860.1 hypothetical protein [Nocardiopsis sp. DSM 44743]
MDEAGKHVGDLLASPDGREPGEQGVTDILDDGGVTVSGASRTLLGATGERSPDATETTVLLRDRLGLPTVGEIGGDLLGVEGAAAARDTGLPVRAQGLPSRPVPDTIIDEADHPGLAVRAVSLRGDRNRVEGRPRQESFGLYPLEHGGERFVLATTACGFPSVRDADRVRRLLWRGVAARMPEIAAPLRDPEHFRSLCALLVEQAMETAPVGALTSALVRLSPEGETTDCLLFGTDVAAARLLRAGGWEPLPATLPADPDGVHVNGHRIAPGEALLMCGTGLSGPMGDTGTADRLAAQWGAGHVPGRMEFASQLDFRADGHEDDRTAICLWGL